MKKDIPVFFLVENTQDIADIKGFISAWAYNKNEWPHPNEWGKIITDCANIRFLAITSEMLNEKRIQLPSL